MNFEGGEWRYRVNVTSLSKEEQTVAIYNYIGAPLTGEDSLELIGKAHKGLSNNVGVCGNTKEHGKFQISMIESDNNVDIDYEPKGKEWSSNNDLRKTMYEGIIHQGEDQLWQVKHPVIKSLRYAF